MLPFSPVTQPFSPQSLTFNGNDEQRLKDEAPASPRVETSTDSAGSHDSYLQNIVNANALTVSSKEEFTLAAAPLPPTVIPTYIASVPVLDFTDLDARQPNFVHQKTERIRVWEEGLEQQLQDYANPKYPLARRVANQLNSNNEFANCIYDTSCNARQIFADTCVCPTRYTDPDLERRVFAPQEVYDSVATARKRVARNTVGLIIATPAVLAASSAYASFGTTSAVALCAVGCFSQILTLCTAGVLTYFCSGDFGGADQKGISLLEKNFEDLTQHMIRKWNGNEGAFKKLQTERASTEEAQKTNMAQLAQLEIKRKELQDQAANIFNNQLSIKNTLMNIGWPEKRVNLLVGTFLLTAGNIAAGQRVEKIEDLKLNCYLV